jgi:hypothetical protein
MNIENMRTHFLIDVIHYLHFVQNTVLKQWIVKKIMVEFEFTEHFLDKIYLEQSACIDSSWPLRTIKYIQKFERICYIRITEIVRYEQAERMCRNYGLQLAIIDNIQLLERLKQLNMCKIK